MDIRDLSWKTRPAGNTLIAEIARLAEKVGIAEGKRKDIRWLAENLRSHALKDKGCCCEHKVLISYVDLALQQGINSLSG